MALNPQIRAELERRGPANVREFLRTSASPEPDAPVELLDGVSERRSNVEGWLREKELVAEGVTQDTLKWAKIAGIGTIVAGLIGITAICVTIHLDRQANQPKLTLAGPRIDLRGDPKSIWLDFANIGKTTARQVKAILFEVSKNKDWKAKQEIGEATVEAAAHVLPGAGGLAKITLTGQIPDLLLACVSYYDENNNLYQQAFLLNLGAEQEKGLRWHDELEQPNVKVCVRS